MKHLPNTVVKKSLRENETRVLQAMHVAYSSQKLLRTVYRIIAVPQMRSTTRLQVEGEVSQLHLWHADREPTHAVYESTLPQD